MTFVAKTLSRLKVLRAMAFIVVARFLVRFVRLSAWRGSIGVIVDPEQALAQDVQALGPEARANAGAVAWQVERACGRLPGTSRCLPRAVAFCWLLRRKNIPLVLVIAMHKFDRTGEHAYHAWVEAGGEMLIGHCERDDYHALMAFGAGRPTAVSRTEQAGK